MRDAARKLAFEEAARLRDLLVVVRGRRKSIPEDEQKPPS